ncbi:DeoR/GlpR transcriptional regulator [Nakamurella flavida]|uniref:Lactose phosphotransferase system repressor n=1 Tax=Nakamurella flavida TaxID=363630 RepID=A0A938YL03_9ACTN|nr:DeoR/GlpR family DNA-binding transcription regulator [Nakamurella flavida]MBM9476628.1 DeoR/GlpR transcriptional regulator [Nakamurella flavida]MDP9778934.1 DeoR/GlpR family transcriptional regulator of sugar metabolism [Nakamurella flavida]
MSRTVNAERRRGIVLATRAEGRIEVADLADRLGVAQETIRRDLTVLEAQGLVRRSHGAAYPLDGAGFETTLAFRSTHLVGEKQRIAEAAVDRIGVAQSLFLDDGFTPLLVAQRLARVDRPLTVITPSISVAGALAQAAGHTVIVLGGGVRAQTLSTAGPWANAMLDDLVLDLAVLGTNGISLDRGLTTPDPAVSALKARVIARTRRRMFVGVHTKFGIDSFARFADVGDFQVLVTDRGLRSVDAARYSALGPDVIRA